MRCTSLKNEVQFFAPLTPTAVQPQRQSKAKIVDTDGVHQATWDSLVRQSPRGPTGDLDRSTNETSEGKQRKKKHFLTARRRCQDWEGILVSVQKFVPFPFPQNQARHSQCCSLLTIEHPVLPVTRFLTIISNITPFSFNTNDFTSTIYLAIWLRIIFWWRLFLSFSF